MDSETLLYDIELVSNYGIVLSTEQKAALQSSLIELKQAERFASLVFWGKITGISRDYYVAQGIAIDPVSTKKSFFRSAQTPLSDIIQHHAHYRRHIRHIHLSHRLCLLCV
jgi:hypothetical protein